MNAPDEEPTFAAPWEAKAFALAVALRDAGHLSWPTFSGHLAERIAAAPDGAYYEHWLAALEELVSAGAHSHER